MRRCSPHAHRRWHHRAHHRLRHSLRARLVAVFLLLAIGVAAAFMGGMQKAFGFGWREVARPLVSDYVDRVVADLGAPPSVERAQALVRRVPLAVKITGPSVNWQSAGGEAKDMFLPHWAEQAGEHDASRLLVRTLPDGHRVELSLNVLAWQDRPRRVGWITLAALLCLTALAYAYVRRLFRPIDDIRAGAQRYGAADFSQPIPVRRHDELGDLAEDVNAMARKIHQMLEAKRGLLLAISHELRSPLTRARLNTELLPDEPGTQPTREALLRDLAAMRDLVSGLLEGERLGQGHSALQLEASDLGALLQDAVDASAFHAPAGSVPVLAPLPELAPMALDRARIRLLLRNLLDNAVRHSAEAAQPPDVALLAKEGGATLTVRDHGPGVDEAELARLSEPFYRVDAARQRTTGGVGLGLYLVRLVAEAHGGTLTLENAAPGLRATVRLPRRVL